MQIEYAPDLYLSDKSSAWGLRYSSLYPMSDGLPAGAKCKFCGLYCTRRYKVSDPDSWPASLIIWGKHWDVCPFNTGAELAAKDAARIGRALEKRISAYAGSRWPAPMATGQRRFCRKVKKPGVLNMSCSDRIAKRPGAQAHGKRVVRRRAASGP